jgi:hypothetical protein
VSADGELLVASADEHPDLFWGLRGGGGNFGVVTSFEYRLHSLGPTVLAGLLAWPMAKAGEVLRFFRDFVADAPDEVGIMANLRLAPALPLIPDELHGRPIVALIVCYAGPIHEGEEVPRPLRELKAPALDTVGPKPYVAHQAMFDPAYPHGRHYYWKSWKLPPLTDGAIDVIVEQAAAITSPLSAIPNLHPGRGRSPSRRHRPRRAVPRAGRGRGAPAGSQELASQDLPTQDRFVVVGRRHPRTNNSWMHNVPTLMKGRELCTLVVNRGDAVRLGLVAGGKAEVTSRVGWGRADRGGHRRHHTRRGEHSARLRARPAGRGAVGRPRARRGQRQPAHRRTARGPAVRYGRAQRRTRHDSPV